LLRGEALQGALPVTTKPVTFQATLHCLPSTLHCVSTITLVQSISNDKTRKVYLQVLRDKCVQVKNGDISSILFNKCYI